MCAFGCICVAAAAAPRPLFITSWCLRATCRRFRPRREECLRSSFSLVLPLLFLIACLRPLSPACYRRGRRHRSGCASLTVTRRSISLTCPLHNFKKICLRVQLVPQERTSMRIVDQITNKSSKTSITVIFQARMLQCTVGQIVYMPVPQFVEVIVDAVPMKAVFFVLKVIVTQRTEVPRYVLSTRRGCDLLQSWSGKHPFTVHDFVEQKNSTRAHKRKKRLEIKLQVDCEI